jgi:hypothetical protein
VSDAQPFICLDRICESVRGSRWVLAVEAATQQQIATGDVEVASKTLPLLPCKEEHVSTPRALVRDPASLQTRGYGDWILDPFGDR